MNRSNVSINIVLALCLMTSLYLWHSNYATASEADVSLAARVQVADATPTSDPVVVAEKQYQTAIGEAKAQRDSEVKAAKDHLIANLKGELAVATRNGSLDTAVYIRDRLKVLESTPTTGPTTNPESTFADSGVIPADKTTDTGAIPADKKLDAILFSSGDDHYSLYVNGNLVCCGGGDVVQSHLQLAIGDIITVQGFPKRFEGFACFIAFPSAHKCIISDALHWKCYTPRDPNNWYDVDGIGGRRSVVVGEPRERAAEERVIKPNFEKVLHGNQQIIWGDENVAYLTLKIATDCFRDSTVALPPVR